MIKKYEEILREVEDIQTDLMRIENYDEEAYQRFEETIDVLYNIIESGETE